MDFNCFNFFESKSAFNVLVSTANLHLYTAGLLNLAPNLFYTDNPAEVVYYVAGTGVVHNRDTNTQKHFFGHNNTIR